MRIGVSSRGGGWVSMGCLGWLLVILVILGLIGWGVSSLTGANAASRPPAYSVRLTPVTQDWTDNCIPAAGSVFLAAFGIRASQDTLAVQMHTRANHGTSNQDEVRVLDAWLAPRRLDVTGVMGLNARQLAATLTGQLRAGRPVLLTVWGNLLPWRLALGGGWSGHELVAAGIRGQVVKVWDPEVPSMHGGWHVITIAQLENVLRKDSPSVFTSGGYR